MALTCKYCYHQDGQHEQHCPEVNGKMAEWLAGYGAAKEGDTENEPVVERNEKGELLPKSDLTYGLGWAVGSLERLEDKNCPGK